MEYMTLMGAEQVQSAGVMIRNAAESMGSAANTFSEAVDRMGRILGEHADRIEQAMAEKPSKNRTSSSNISYCDLYEKLGLTPPVFPSTDQSKEDVEAPGQEVAFLLFLQGHDPAPWSFAVRLSPVQRIETTGNPTPKMLMEALAKMIQGIREEVITAAVKAWDENNSPGDRHIDFEKAIRDIFREG